MGFVLIEKPFIHLCAELGGDGVLISGSFWTPEVCSWPKVIAINVFEANMRPETFPGPISR